MNIVNTSDLKTWSSKARSSSQLAELVCRLIFATGTKLKGISVGLEKNVWKGGWDGYVDSDEATPFIPKGISLWEWGISENMEKKANEDYNKRMKNLLGQDPKDATFVFVTPQVWPESVEWIAKKKNAGAPWMEIKVIDGEQLEKWLILAPLQSYWLARQIGIIPIDSIRLPMEFWQDWSKNGLREILPKLVTTGREAHEQMARNYLVAGPSSEFAITAATKDEALAFFIAMILQSPDAEKENFLARAVLVDDEKAFRDMMANRDSLILIPWFSSPNSIRTAVSKGHHILLPQGADDYVRDANVLPRPDRDGFVQVLQSMGYSEDEARRISRDSGRSITVFRRSQDFDGNIPAWVHGNWKSELIAAMLAGKWQDDQPGDKAILEKLSGRSYRDLTRQLKVLEQQPDSPMRKIGTQWRLTSTFDCWSYFSKFCTTEDFQELRNSVLTVLSEINPALKLHPNDRFRAGLIKEQPIYSHALREGLVQSLIIVAVFADNFDLSVGYSSQLWVDHIVHDLTKEAGSQLYQSLTDVAPQLAEASPDGFMRMLEQALNSQQDQVRAIFEEGNDPFNATHYQSGYLWALESIAWDTRYLSAALLLLGRLAEIDPGGRLSNRPINSLLHIFVPWRPQTCATVDQRIEAFRLLGQKCPGIAWGLGLTLVGDLSVQYPTARCRWRLSEEICQQGQTYASIAIFNSALITIMTGLAGTDGKRLGKLVARITANMNPADRQTIFGHIQDNAELVREGRLDLWHAARTALYEHRYHSFAPWALPDSELAPVDEFYETFEPTEVVSANIWVFQEYYPQFPDGYAAARAIDPNIEAEVHKREQETARALLQAIGIDALLGLIPDMKFHHSFGNALAEELTTGKDIDAVLNLLQADDKNSILVAQSFLARKHTNFGMPWIEQALAGITGRGFSSISVARFANALPSDRITWDLLSTLPEAVSAQYWILVKPYVGRSSATDRQYVVDQLIKAGRHRTALEICARYPADIHTDALIAVLDSAKITETKTIHLSSSDITDVLTALDTRLDIDIKAKLRLELIYAEILDQFNNRRADWTHQAFAESPALFMEHIALIAVDDDGNHPACPTDMTKEQYEIFKTKLYLHIHNWHTVPGLDKSGKLDKEYLTEWIAVVREIAKAIRLTTIVDAQIGILLSHAPTETDGAPTTDICDIIENLDSAVINRNYNAGWYNQHGMTTRGVFEGGEIERDMVAMLRRYSKRLSIKWPSIAAIYEDLAKSYEARAADEDSRAEQLDHEHS